MDAATIQAKIYAGFSKASSRVGFPFSIFRLTGATAAPLSSSSIGSLNIAASSSGYAFTLPRDYGKATWCLLADGSQLQPMDILVEQAEAGPGQGPRTFFIASMTPLLPILGVLCNTALTIKREQANPSVGVLSYGGDNAVDEIVMMQSFPASVLQGSKGEKAETGLPDATRQPWYSVLMPAIAGVSILPNDLAYDAEGNRYKISSCELSNLGWRLSMEYSQP